MILEPKYRFFKQRLLAMKLNEVIDKHPINLEHFAAVKSSIEQQGLLLPMLVDHKKHIISGSHRLKVLKAMQLASHSLFYQAKNKDESFFFHAFIKQVHEQHEQGVVDSSLQFLFNKKLKPHTMKVQYLFSEPMSKLV
jgi:hypothetical protein